MITHPHVKVNLGLNVLRRRKDGFHDLETLFVPCHSFHDTLEIVTGDDWSRTCEGLSARYRGKQLIQAVSPDGGLMITLARREGVDWDPLEDLTARAWRLLRADFELPPLKIYLEKTAPVGAGLGGGSADGAFALRMIARLAQLPLSDQNLAGYAARLGSDCAFFLWNRPLFGSGRGEILTDAPAGLPPIVSGEDPIPPGGLRLELRIPEGIAVSTAEAYRGITPRIPATPLRDVLAGDVSRWREELANDFEETVFRAHPSLAAIKAELYASGACYAALSGSGSALFGLFRP